MAKINKVADWFECSDGYPDDACINRLYAQKFDPQEAANLLVNDLPKITKEIDCVECTVSSAFNDDGKGWHVEYHTRGWSGAEDLIDALLHHFWITHFHIKWETGGHFYFWVEDGVLNPEPPDA